jgi:hypothetical protein
MASTYSNLKIELIGTGDQSGTWGVTTNTNLGTALEQAITGYGTAQFTSDADLTLGYTDSNASQTFRNLVLNLTSSVTLTATRNLLLPSTALVKGYYIFNNTTGGQAIQVKYASGTGVTIPNGRKAVVFGDGTNVSTPMDFFLSSNGIRTEVATGQDAVVIAGRAGGSNNYAVTVTPNVLTGNVTLTLPDQSGVVALTSQITSVTTIYSSAFGANTFGGF